MIGIIYFIYLFGSMLVGILVGLLVDYAGLPPKLSAAVGATTTFVILVILLPTVVGVSQ